MSITTVLSSKEHHSLSFWNERSRGHRAGSVYQPLSSSSKSHLWFRQPPLEVVGVLHLDQVNRPLLLHVGEGERVGAGRGVDGVDPVDERLLVAHDQRSSIEHDPLPGPISKRHSKSLSWRAAARPPPEPRGPRQ